MNKLEKRCSCSNNKNTKDGDTLVAFKKTLSTKSKSKTKDSKENSNKTNNIMNILLSDINCDETLMKMKDFPEQFYSFIRDSIQEKYQPSEDLIYNSRENYNPKEFREVLLAYTNGHHGSILNPWIFRMPDNLERYLPVVDRINLNVYQDAELIEKLDKYLSKNCHGAFYKCAGSEETYWNQMHNTITIYLIEKATTKVLCDIAKLAEPHVRYNPNEIMIGTKIIQGVYQVFEATKETLEPLLAKAKKLNLEPEFYEWLERPGRSLGSGLFSMRYGKLVVHVSPDMVAATNDMLDLFEDILRERNLL